MKTHMTASQVIQTFHREVLPGVIKQYGPKDAPAIRAAFNDYTDMLCKEGSITRGLYAVITYPY